MTSSDPRPLPPGTSGLPLLGETLPFLRDIFGFVRKRIGDGIFRTHLLGQPTVIMAGPEACALWLDETIIQRDGAFPKPVRELFGGVSLPLLDGPAHRVRKGIIMQALTPQALASYLPVLDRCVENAIDRWAKQGEFRWLDELKRLAIEGISATIFGLSPGKEMDSLLEDYLQLLKGFTGLPVNLPGTDFALALKARDRILERLETLVKTRQKAPGEDGVSRLLAARGPNGETLAISDLRLELHHIVLAGLIIFAEFAEIILALEQHPELRERLRSEIVKVSSAGPLTREHLSSLPGMVSFLLEVKRHCKNVPVSFGKAKRTFEFKGYMIPEGWLVFLAVGENNDWHATYQEPDRFDPARFGADREEHKKHPHAYVPQGPGAYTDHKCAGFDFSTLFMEVFSVRLLRDSAWKISQQDLSFRVDVVPPEPREGLRATVNRR